MNEKLTVPSAMFVEIAIDAMAKRDPDLVKRELHELHVATGSGSKWDEQSYLLGLETARAILETMPAAVQANVML